MLQAESDVCSCELADLSEIETLPIIVSSNSKIAVPGELDEVV